MKGFGFDFEWAVFASYAVEELQELLFKPRLIGSGEPLITRPLANFLGLYLHLAKSEATIEGHQAFAKKYGLLTDRKWEFASCWERKVRGMRRLVAMVEDKANWNNRDGSYVPYEHPVSFTFRSVPNSKTGEMTLQYCAE